MPDALPTSANFILRDRALRHEVGIRRLSNQTIRLVIGELERMIPRLEKELRARFAWIAERGFDKSDFTLRRLEANLRGMREILRESYSAVGATAKEHLLDFAKYETAWQAGELAAQLVGVATSADIVRISARWAGEIVTRNPFAGKLLKEWVSDYSNLQQRRLWSGLREGMLRGDSIDDIVRSVFGRAVRVKGEWIRKGGSAGIELLSRDARTMMRTAYNGVATSVRTATLQDNAEFLKGIQWSTALDDRVCPVCAPRDGLLYTTGEDASEPEPIGHSIPWNGGPGRQHPNDRCTAIPVLKSAEELGLKAAKMPEAMRQSMDGLVPAKTTFTDWANAGGKERLDDLYGVNRSRLIRSGDVKIDDLWDDKGRYLTLDQLKERDAA